MNQLISKKDIDRFQGMLPDDVITKCINERFVYVKKWIVLPFLNVSGDAILITRRSETARKATVLLDNKKLVFIKEIPWYCSSKQFVVYQTNILNDIYNQGAKIPKIIPSVDGELFTTANYGVGEKYLIVQDFISGLSWKGTLIEAQNASKQLAILHRQMEKHYNKNKESYYPVTNTFLKSLEMLEVASKSVKEKEKCSIIDFDKYHKYATEKIKVFREESNNQGYNEVAFPIHGDFNPWNIIFSKENNVKVIIDFDNSSISNPNRDVVEMVLVFCFFNYKKNSTRFETLPNVFNKSLAIVILKEYFMYSKYKYYNMLPSLAATVCIELIALAIARYDFTDYAQLYELDVIVYEIFTEIVEEIKKND